MDVLELLERIQSGLDYSCPDCGEVITVEQNEHKSECQLKAAIDALRSGRLVVVAKDYVDAVDELLEVANLRGDNDLPHPCNDHKLWTARMQTAWDVGRETRKTKGAMGMTWQEICDKVLAGKFAELKGVGINQLFYNLNGTDEVILDDEEKKILGIEKEQGE